MNERLLVVEDEVSMRTVLEDCLARHGYRVLTARDGEEGLRRAGEETPDLILLDVMMPRLDGFTVCRELRRLGFAGRILVLTARGRTEDRVRGLDLGADDYLVKPFSREELLARVRALLRRGRSDQPTARERRFGNVRVDVPGQRVWKDGREVELAPKEFAMLRLFLDHPSEVISRERFLDLVWGVTAYPTTRTVDRHVVSLRQKIEDDPARPVWIQTVHGAGYRFEDSNRDAGAGE
ncbi:MAG: response regulator transcription factor [Verrucomicrobiales bacterium]|nr:response regulator transcription factor [Verrucomicrobiales bacterium]